MKVIVVFVIACKADQSYMLGLNEASYDYSMMLFFKSSCRVNGSGLSCQETWTEGIKRTCAYTLYRISVYVYLQPYIYNLWN